MEKWNKNYPVWFRIKGTDVVKPTLLGVEKYMQQKKMTSCIINTLQYLEIEDVLEEVDHPLNNHRMLG